MATPRLGLVVEDKPTELSCKLCHIISSTCMHVLPYKGMGLFTLRLILGAEGWYQRELTHIISLKAFFKWRPQV